MSNFSVTTVNNSYNMTYLDNTVRVIPVAAISIGLPPIGSVVEGQSFAVTDAGNAASTYNITVASLDGTLINGTATTSVITVNGGSLLMTRVNGGWFIANDINAIQGPGSSTADTVPRYNGTSGAVLKTTGIIITDTNGMSGYLAVVNANSNTTYTLLTADAGKVIELNSSVSRALTLPNSFVQGFGCDVVQTGSAKVVFTPSSGATLTGNSAVTTTAGVWARCSLYVSSNVSGTAAVWVLSGNVG